MRFFPATTDIEREDWSSRLHLAHREIVLRVAGQARIQDFLYPLLQKLANLNRTRRLFVNAQVQRFQTLCAPPRR